MNKTKKRLIACFKQVFPTLSEESILTASEDTLEEWNSLAIITLIIAVETEFGKSIDIEKLALLTSFNAFLYYLGEVK